MRNARKFAQLTETLKQKLQAKYQRIRRYEIRETHYRRNNSFDTKIRRHQVSRNLPNNYMYNDYVENPNRRKKLHTFGRADLTATRAKRMSTWK